MALPETGLFAVSGSTTYAITGTGVDWLMFRIDDGRPLPAHIGAGRDRLGRAWVKAPKSAGARCFRVRATVAWRGERLELGHVDGDLVEVHVSDPRIANRLELEGDQHNGFRAYVPVAELTVVDVREEDIRL